MGKASCRPRPRASNPRTARSGRVTIGWKKAVTRWFSNISPRCPAPRMTLRPDPYRHLERAAVFRGLERLAEEAQARGVESAALATAWALRHPRVDAAIIGPRNAAHLAAALAALTIELSDEDVRRLAALFETGVA